MHEEWIPIVDNKNLLNSYVLTKRDRELLEKGIYFAELYSPESRKSLEEYSSINIKNSVAIIRDIDIVNKKILIYITNPMILSEDYNLVARIRGFVKNTNPTKLIRLIGFDIEIIEKYVRGCTKIWK